jgi:hypothetical protein
VKSTGGLEEMSVYRVTEGIENNRKPLAPYLQPSQAGFDPANVSAHSARLTGTQIIGLAIAIGCLILFVLGVSTPTIKSFLPGQSPDMTVMGDPSNGRPAR